MLLEGDFVFGEVDGHWGCCNGQDEEGESENGELHFVLRLGLLTVDVL